LPALLRRALPRRRAAVRAPVARRAPALPGAPASDGADGHVVAAADAGDGRRRRQRGPHDRRALRRERDRRRARSALRAVGADAPARDPGRRAGGRRLQRAGRTGLAGAETPRPGGRPGGRPGAARARRRSGAHVRVLPLRAVACALRAVGLLRAVAGGPLVPHRRRGGQVHGLHLRHRAERVPARLRVSRACAGRRRRSCSVSARCWSPPRSP
jgi:hypothetical protein